MSKSLLILLLPLFLASALAVPVDFSKPEERYVTEGGGVFRYYTAGIVRPDEGAIEVICKIDQPLSEFGNDWEFAWTIAPVKEIAKGGNTLMGLFVPARPWKQGALRFIARNGQTVAAADSQKFEYPIGKPFVISCTWGKEVRVYVNGTLLASGKLPAPIPAGFFPYAFKVERFAPFNVQSIKISSKELEASELCRDANAGFSPDEDTTLIAKDGLGKAERFVSSWHKEKKYVHLMPVLREVSQSFLETEKHFVPFISINHGTEAKTYQAEWTFTDVDGKVVEKKSESIKVEPGGKYQIHELSLGKNLPRGFYSSKFTVTGGESPLVNESAVAILPNPKSYPLGKLSEVHGQHASYDFDHRVLTKAGIRWSRAWAKASVFLWWTLEPVSGQFDFRRADAWVNEMQTAGMEVLGVLGYPPRWAAAEPEESVKKAHELAERSARWKPADLKAWERYVETTVKRYKGKVKYWEVYNEVNFHPPGPPATFSGSTEDYFELLKIVHRKVKEIDPSIQVLISGFSTPPADQKMPMDLLKMGAGSYFDIFNFHGYHGIKPILPWLDELKKQKPGTPYWMTEQMWFEVSDTPRRIYLTVELYLEFLEAGSAKFFNMGIEENFFNRFTGWAPAQDFLVATVLHRQVGSCDTLEHKIKFEGDKFFPIRHQLKRSDGKYLTVIGLPTGSYELQFASAPEKIEDIFGRPVPSAASLRGKSVVYLVSAAPLVITRADVQQAAVLTANGGFESMEGDSMGGLSGLKPMQWVYRDKAFDPKGVIIPTDKTRNGRFAMQVDSTGAGRVYFFQDILLRSPGTFTLSAWMRKKEGEPTPYLFIFDRNKNKVENKNFENVGSEWTLCSMSMTLEPGQDAIAVGLGIGKGQGSIVIDDVSFGPEKPKFDGAKYAVLDLRPAANQTLTGFADLGQDNLSLLETGERVLAGHSFKILSDENGKQNAIVMLAGSTRPNLPKQAEIAVGQNLKSLVFLHTAYGVKAGANEDLGSYTVTYADGTSAELPLRHKENIDDWYRPVADPKVPVGDKIVPADGVERLLFCYRWTNPSLDKKIQSVRMTSNGKSILVLAAISGEK